MQTIQNEIDKHMQIGHSFVEISHSDLEINNEKPKASQEAVKTISVKQSRFCENKSFYKFEFLKRKALFYKSTYQGEKAIDLLVHIYKEEKRIKLESNGEASQRKVPFKYRKR